MRLFVLLGVFALAPSVNAAVPGDTIPLGVGFGVGVPSVFSVKYWTGSTRAIQASLSWAFTRDWLWLTVAHLYHTYEVVPQLGEIKVPLYFGVGAHMHGGRESEEMFAVQVPFGVALEWRRADIFLEIEPYLFVWPEVHVDLSGVLGARFYF